MQVWLKWIFQNVPKPNKVYKALSYNLFILFIYTLFSVDGI